MIDLLQITNDPALARRCDVLPGMRLFVDLEVNGKAERQAGRNTFISTHQLEDVGRIKSQLQRSRLMVRVNPLHAGTPDELDAVLAQGADWVMLPMFQTPDELQAFSRIVAGRALQLGSSVWMGELGLADDGLQAQAQAWAAQGRSVAWLPRNSTGAGQPMGLNGCDVA